MPNASTLRDLSANRDAVEQSIEDALGARLATVLASHNFAIAPAAVYAEVLANRLAQEATTILFDLLQSNLDLQAATKAN